MTNSFPHRTAARWVTAAAALALFLGGPAAVAACATVPAESCCCDSAGTGASSDCPMVSSMEGPVNAILAATPDLSPVLETEWFSVSTSGGPTVVATVFAHDSQAPPNVRPSRLPSFPRAPPVLPA